MENQSPIESLIMGLSIGEGIFYLPDKVQKQVLTNISDFNGQLQWGTLTSLALVTTSSLSKGYSINDLVGGMQNWLRKGYMAPNLTIQTNEPTTKQALLKYAITRDPINSGLTNQYGENDEVLTRILPFALYLRSQYGKNFVNDDAAMTTLHRAIGITHNTLSSLVASGMLVMIIDQLFDNENKRQAIESGLAIGFEYYSRHEIFRNELKNYDNLNLPDFKHFDKRYLQNDGSAVKTLEISIWALLQSEDFSSSLEIIEMIAERNKHAWGLTGALAGLIYKDNLQTYADYLVSSNSIKQVIKAAQRSSRFYDYDRRDNAIDKLFA